MTTTDRFKISFLLTKPTGHLKDFWGWFRGLEALSSKVLPESHVSTWDNLKTPGRTRSSEGSLSPLVHTPDRIEASQVGFHGTSLVSLQAVLQGMDSFFVTGTRAPSSGYSLEMSVLERDLRIPSDIFLVLTASPLSEAENKGAVCTRLHTDEWLRRE